MKPERTVFPMFPASNWWPLRGRFKRTLPAIVDLDYLTTVLGIETKTARNLLPALKQLGLVDSDGAPTDRANRWRVDEEYPDVCSEIRREIYPPGLADAIPDPVGDFPAAVRWFMRESGVGEPAARRMARLYQLLTEADSAKGTEGAELPAARAGRLPTERNGIPRERNGITAPARARSIDAAAPVSSIATEPPGSASPRFEVHLHFSPDLSPDQIDQIFRSMAKHVK